MSDQSEWYRTQFAHAEALWVASSKEFGKVHTAESACALVDLYRHSRDLMMKVAAYENTRRSS